MSCLQILPLTDPTYSLSNFHQMILLALAQTAAILEIQVQITGAQPQYSFAFQPSSTRRTSLPLLSHQYSGNIQRLFTNNQKIFRDFSPTTRKCSKTFHQHPKIFKDFSACKLVIAANYQLYSGNIQRPFGQQQPAAAINSNQPTAAINSSNQQKQPTAAINSSNQQQQLTAATSISNQQQQLATTTSSHPTSSIHTIHDDFR